MAIIDKFLSVQTEGAGGTLIVRGETVDEKGERMDLGHDVTQHRPIRHQDLDPRPELHVPERLEEIQQGVAEHVRIGAAARLRAAPQDEGGMIGRERVGGQAGRLFDRYVDAHRFNLQLDRHPVPGNGRGFRRRLLGGGWAARGG